MVRLLFLKMVRDIRKSLAAYLICMVVIGVGFCGYCVLSVASDHLEASRDVLYETCAFSDGFAEVYEAPAFVAQELEALPQIERAQARIVKNARLSGFHGEDVELQLISYQKGGLNVPLLFEGIDSGNGALQMVIGNAFAKAREIPMGTALPVLVSGREVELTVTGSGLSPENIYLIKDIVEMLPNPAGYDAGFVSYDTLASLYGMEDKANGFVFTLREGYEVEDVKEQVEEILKPYGCIRVYGRKDQMSASVLEMELEQVGKVASAMPFLFLMVAAIILYITMHRLMEQQRIQIGTMLSFGISRRIIAAHYLGYGVFIGAVGGAAGGLLGNLCARPMADYYRMYFNLPDVAVPISVRYLLLGTLMAGCFCGGVSYLCSRKLGELNPAEAMRPPAPKSARVTVLERIPGFLSLFTVPGIMAVRSVARNRRRSLLSVAGIACAFMITATLVSMYTLFDVFLFDYLEKVQKQDFMVYFEEPLPVDEVVSSIYNEYIEEAEPVAEVAATLMHGAEELDGTIQAIPQASRLCRLFDERDYPVETASEGIVISTHMAALLKVEAGDLLDVRVSYPQERISRVPVTGIMAQYLGSTAYMSMEGLGEISEYRDVCTGLLLKASPGAEEALWSAFEEAPKVTGLESRHAKLQKWREMMGSFDVMMGSMASLGVLIGLAVLYTSALISYEELKRELSTLLMLGLRPARALEVLSVGQWLLTLAGIVIGIPMTFAASRGMAASLTTEMYSMPDFVDWNAIWLSILLTFAAVALSNRMILRKLRKISPAALLMERE